MSTRSGRMVRRRNPVACGRQRRFYFRALLGLSALLVGLLSAPAAFADKITFTVTYKPIEGCPDRGAFIHGVQTMSRIAVPVGAAEQPDIVFAVDVKANASKSKITGKLVITQGVQSSDRTVTGVTCQEVTTALALIAALSIDPDAALPAIPEPLPLPPDWAGPPILGSQPALVTGPAPVIIPNWSPPLSWRPAMIPGPTELDLVAPPLPVDPLIGRVTRPSVLEIGFGAQFVLDVGPAPVPLIGAAGQIQLRDLASPAWSLRAELSYTVTPASEPDETTLDLTGEYRMLRGRFIGCIPGWLPKEWLRLWPCATFGGGGQWAEFTRSDGTTNESAGPWLETGLAARLELAPLPWLAFDLQVGPALALVRSKFTAGEGVVVYEPLPVLFGLNSGLSAAF